MKRVLTGDIDDTNGVPTFDVMFVIKSTPEGTVKLYACRFDDMPERLQTHRTLNLVREDILAQVQFYKCNGNKLDISDHFSEMDLWNFSHFQEQGGRGFTYIEKTPTQLETYKKWIEEMHTHCVERDAKIVKISSD